MRGGLVCLATLVSCSATDRVAPSFSLPLDEKPEVGFRIIYGNLLVKNVLAFPPLSTCQNRWGPVALDIVNFHGGFNFTYLPVLEWLEKEVPASAWELINPVMDVLQYTFGEYDAEVKGFYAALATAYPWAANSGLISLPKVRTKQ